MASECNLGCPGIHFADQVGLKLRNPPISLPNTEIKGVHHYAWYLKYFIVIFISSFDNSVQIYSPFLIEP